MLKLIKKFRIKKWLDDHEITNYKINDDLTVDVSGNVKLTGRNLISLPIQFGIVAGNFDCGNNQLTSLKGCPKKIVGFFNCINNQLTSLLHGPGKVGRGYFCHNNQITSLEHSPANIDGKFSCASNKLTSLEGGPISSGSYYCSNNSLKTLRGSPRQIDGYFDCATNELTSLTQGPEYVSIDYICRDNPIKDMVGFHTKFERNFIHVGELKIKELEDFYDGSVLQIIQTEMMSILLAEELSQKLNKNSPDKLRMKI